MITSEDIREIALNAIEDAKREGKSTIIIGMTAAKVLAIASRLEELEGEEFARDWDDEMDEDEIFLDDIDDDVGDGFQ